MSHSTTALQTREVKDAVYQTQVRIQAQKEKDSHLRWEVHLGDDLFSTEEREQVLREQELAASEYMMQKVISEKVVDFAQTFTKLSSHRLLRRAGQRPNRSPVLNAYGYSQLKVRQRVLSLFQQAVRKVIFQIRMKSRLLLLRELISSSRNQNRERSDSSLDEKQWSLNLSLDKLLAFELPSFACANLKDELAINSFGQVQVKPIKADFKPSVPFFSLRVAQHYTIMGYQEVPVFGAKALFDNSISCRSLRTGAEDELIPAVTRPSLDSHEEVLQNEQEPEQDFDRLLLFDGFENPPSAHPSRIFVPNPSVYAFQPTPLYIETDFMFNLSPLSRQKRASKVPRDYDDGVHTSSAQNICYGKEDIIKQGISIWKMFPHQALTTLPRLGDAINPLILPMEAPAALQDLPESMAEDITVEANEVNGVSLSPEMLQAAFELFEKSLPKEFTEQNVKDDEETPQQPLETPLQPQPNRYGRKILARLKYINQLGKCVSTHPAAARDPPSRRKGENNSSKTSPRQRDSKNT